MPAQLCPTQKGNWFSRRWMSILTRGRRRHWSAGPISNLLASSCARRMKISELSKLDIIRL